MRINGKQFYIGDTVNATGFNGKFVGILKSINIGKDNKYVVVQDKKGKSFDVVISTSTANIADKTFYDNIDIL